MRLLHFVVLGMLTAAGAAWAQPYPQKSKPIRIIIPFGAASSTDLLSRALGRGITELSGVNVIVENKPGAEGVIGMQAAKNATPDGYTLLMTTNSTQVLNPHMLSNLPYHPVTDFVPVTGVAKFSLIMNVGPTVTQKTARELIEAARANPGKYSFGSGTTMTRLAGEMLQHMSGVKMLSVPYKSVAEAMTALTGAHVHIMFADLPSSSAHYKTGRVNPVAVTSPTRIVARPDLPTLRESGVADYDLTGWWAAYFPAKTPPAIVASMREIIQKAAKTTYVTDMFINFALEPLLASGDELAKLQRSDSEKYGKLVRAANLKSE